jgi:hypothetical protein
VWEKAGEGVGQKLSDWMVQRERIRNVHTAPQLISLKHVRSVAVTCNAKNCGTRGVPRLTESKSVRVTNFDATLNSQQQVARNFLVVERAPSQALNVPRDDDYRAVIRTRSFESISDPLRLCRRNLRGTLAT